LGPYPLERQGRAAQGLALAVPTDPTGLVRPPSTEVADQDRRRLLRRFTHDMRRAAQGIKWVGFVLAAILSTSAWATPQRHLPATNPEPRPAAQAEPAGSAVVAISVALRQDAASARLVFDLSAPVSPNAFVLADPDRVIIDLPEVNFQVDPQAGRPARPMPSRAPRTGLVSAFRFGLFAPGRSRIVIDLEGPARIVKAVSERIAGDGPSRLVIELAATDPGAFQQAAAAGARAEAARAEARRLQLAPSPSAPAPTRPVIVLDPGHGGIDAGASGVDGVLEKDVVFAFSSLLAGKLQATGRYAVVMTRSADVFMSLDDRVEVARNAHASLFVSIHADTLSANPQVMGATIYTVSDRASDAEAARIADSENKADLAGGLSVSTGDASRVADILFDLTRRETRTYAHVFSRTLVNYLKDATRLNNNPARSAGFVVLKAPDVPSVLLELGYLSSRVEVKELESPQWRDKASSSIVAAIDRFFASRQQGAAASGRPESDPLPTGQLGTVSRQPQPGEIGANAPLARNAGATGAPH